MADYEQSVFISYAWGTEREDIVNEIDETLQQRGIRIVRDKRALGYRGSIRDFMERIGRGSCVIVVISDKYLRSPNCMFELVEIADNKQFHDRIFPIILTDANIYDPLKRIEYIKFWEAKRKELAKAMKTLDPANLHGIREEMDQYDRIRDKISGITSILKDMNTLTPDMHRDSEFSNLYDAIIERLKENATDVTVEFNELAKKADVESKAKEQAEREAREKEEGDHLVAQKAEEERLAKIEAERKAKEEAERIAAQKGEEERLAKAEAERRAKEEADRLAAQKAEEERLAQAKADAERKAKEEADRLAAHKAEEERIERERAEQERLALARAEEERNAKAEAERIAKLEAERKAREEADRLAAQKAEAERIAQAKAEAERRAKEEAERLAAQKAERERIEREKAEQERLALAKAEAERKAKEAAERRAAQKAEEERLARADAERIAAQKAEAERLARQKVEAERLAKQKAEKKVVPVPAMPAESKGAPVSLAAAQKKPASRVAMYGIAAVAVLAIAGIGISSLFRGGNNNSTNSNLATDDPATEISSIDEPVDQPLQEPSATVPSPTLTAEPATQVPTQASVISKSNTGPIAIDPREVGKLFLSTQNMNDLAKAKYGDQYESMLENETTFEIENPNREPLMLSRTVCSYTDFVAFEFNETGEKVSDDKIGIIKGQDGCSTYFVIIDNWSTGIYPLLAEQVYGGNLGISYDVWGKIKLLIKIP